MIKRSLLLPLLLVAGSLQAQNQAPAENNMDNNKARPIVDSVCLACHMGDGNGNSQTPDQPKLAGQHAEYLYKQMRDFKSLDGHPAARENAIMNGMITMLADDETIKAAAEFYAAQKLEPAAAKNSKDSDAFKLGEKIWRAGIASKGVPACAGCHGPAGKGMAAQYPALAGQYPEYLEIQIKAFRDGVRTNDPAKMMRDIAIKMTDPEIKAVADYTAGLR